MTVLLKNHILLLEEIKEDLKWKDLPCSWIGRENIVKTQCCNLIILPIFIGSVQFQSKSQQIILWKLVNFINYMEMQRVNISKKIGKFILKPQLL